MIKRIFGLAGMFAFALLAISACSSSSTTEVGLPDGTHCRSESSGMLWWETASVACVDQNGKIIGSYSNQ